MGVDVATSEEELVDDLSQTSFRRALALAEGTVSILDRGGKVFTRVWCCYEIYIALAEQQCPLARRVLAALELELVPLLVQLTLLLLFVRLLADHALLLLHGGMVGAAFLFILAPRSTV